MKKADFHGAVNSEFNIDLLLSHKVDVFADFAV